MYDIIIIVKEGRILMTIRWGFINITRNDSVVWNIIKNLLVPVWWWRSDGATTIDIQLIPITTIIMLVVLL